jgi:hypothetical protein
MMANPTPIVAAFGTAAMECAAAGAVKSRISSNMER